MGQYDHVIKVMEKQIDHFDPIKRRAALAALCELADTGEIPVPPMQNIANLHCHSFYSYNGYGYSPSHLAWLGRKHGIQYMGVVDFDVLDAVDEFLDACVVAGVRGIAGIETRVFIPEFARKEINSPGEPGVAYHMGTGFTSSAVPGTAAGILNDISQCAADRNRIMLTRINAFLTPLAVDYEADVLPLTPSGNATERHMVQVLAQKSLESMPDPAAFWGEKFDIPRDDIHKKMQDSNVFQDFLRSKLMKRGGVGYVQPTPESFPTVAEFHRMVISSNALPCAAWLDGTSQGEQQIEDLLGLLIEQGVAALNIVPDRNWNIKDAREKADKLDKLYAVVDLAQRWDLPVLVGTEMNKFGQKLVDDFNTPELTPVRDVFMDGAATLYGHTRLQRAAGIGYQSVWAEEHFSDRKEKNDFYRQAGLSIAPANQLFDQSLADQSPAEVLAAIQS
jgi:hypothetical protein